MIVVFVPRLVLYCDVGGNLLSSGCLLHFHSSITVRVIAIIVVKSAKPTARKTATIHTAPHSYTKRRSEFLLLRGDATISSFPLCASLRLSVGVTQPSIKTWCAVYSFFDQVLQRRSFISVCSLFSNRYWHSMNPPVHLPCVLNYMRQIYQWWYSSEFLSFYLFISFL